MKRRMWTITVSTLIAINVYVGSFYLVLLGQRLGNIELTDDLGLGYHLDYESGPDGLIFTDHPWMKVYSPLSSTIYARSKYPQEKVALSGWGKLVYAAHHWGWSRSHSDDAWGKAASFRGGTHLEWFPERFE